MRIPIPNNKLVAFTLAGALITAIIAGALAVPIDGTTQSGGQADQAGSTASDGPQQVAADAPTPNQDFTPAVKTQTGYEEEEHEEYEEEHEEYEEEEDEEHEEED
jgi:NAD/NADP transhydrogenase alpha subunit